MPVTGETRNPGDPTMEIYDGYEWVAVNPSTGLTLRTIDIPPQDPLEGQIFWNHQQHSFQIFLAGNWNPLEPDMLRHIQEEQELRNRTNFVNDIATATGRRLDQLASNHGLTRGIDPIRMEPENDARFRSRIILNVAPTEQNSVVMNRTTILTAQGMELC